MKPADPQHRGADLSVIDDLVIHYRGAHALMAAVTLGVFDALRSGPRNVGQIASAIGANERAMQILLDALAALGFVHTDADGYRNAPVAEQHLCSDSPASLVSNLQYQQLLAGPWANLPQVVRDGQPAAALGQLLSGQPQFVERYILGMAEISRQPARQLAGKLDLAGVRHVLDVGGGSGVYAEALLAAGPAGQAMDVTVLDLGPTLGVARRRLAGSPWKDRIELWDGDYHAASFGRDRFDLILFSHVLHDEGDDECKSLLQKAFDALRGGGQVVIHDFMPASDHTHPLFAALFSLHMLICTPKGRAYSADEYRTWLGERGFVEAQEMALGTDRPTATTAIVARKPWASLGTA